MKVSYVWEHNGDDTLVYIEDFVGAYTRGESLWAALGKAEREIVSYCKWSGQDVPHTIELICALDAPSDLAIRDADSDVLFESEKAPLAWEEYDMLKCLALKSAADFMCLYEAIPDKQKASIPLRKTFYGNVPRTAEEMYTHTKNVNGYYFGEIGVDADNDGDIVSCRERGFAALEAQGDFLENRVFDGSWGEKWTLRKLLRRFIWHDRIHAKAMYRMAKKTLGDIEIPDVFCFD